MDATTVVDGDNKTLKLRTSLRVCLQTMAMDAATGDSMIIKLECDEPRTIHFNCNIDFI